MKKNSLLKKTDALKKNKGFGKELCTYCIGLGYRMVYPDNEQKCIHCVGSGWMKIPEQKSA